MPRQGAKADPATANVKIVRGTFKAANRRDLDAWVAPLAPNVEVWERDHGTIVTGRDEFRRWLDNYLDAWEHYREAPERLIPVGDKVVALVKSEARGVASQFMVEERHGEVHTVVDGCITRVELYPTYAEALEAAGLDPDEASTDPGDTRGGGRFRARR